VGKKYNQITTEFTQRNRCDWSPKTSDDYLNLLCDPIPNHVLAVSSDSYKPTGS